jgi:hypothetical protein
MRTGVACYCYEKKKIFRIELQRTVFNGLWFWFFFSTGIGFIKRGY